MLKRLRYSRAGPVGPRSLPIPCSQSSNLQCRQSLRSVTLREVAERCHVSVATVSAVVNGASWVSQDTRKRVQKAIDKLGYRPNQLARGLKTQRGHAVGVIVSDLTNPFFTEIVRGLAHALR